MTRAQELGVNYLPLPIVIQDENGREIYRENETGFWEKRERDVRGNLTFFENSDGFWAKREWDSEGCLISYRDSNGFWSKREYDDRGIWIKTDQGIESVRRK